MKYISIPQFFRATIDVRTELIDWWEPEMGDLIETSSGGLRCITNQTDIDFIKKLKEDKKGCSVIPLLTVPQLREFIEYKLNDDIDVYGAGMKGYQISTEWIDGAGISKFEFKTDTPDILLAFWECVQEVCKQKES